jgi:hypothetical protein
MCSSIQDFQMAFGRLVILTRTQCYIYQIPNIDSHVTCDIKDHISLIDVWNHNFATLCKDRITVYSHDGDIQATLPYGQGISREKLSSETVTISIDVMAMIDNHERKVRRTHSCVHQLTTHTYDNLLKFCVIDLPYPSFN